jgi:hypothetical protein
VCECCSSSSGSGSGSGSGSSSSRPICALKTVNGANNKLFQLLFSDHNSICYINVSF